MSDTISSSIHSSTNGHLGCFHVFGTVNKCAMNLGVHESFSVMVLSEYMPKNGFPGSYGQSIFRIFKEAPYCFP